MKLKKRLISLTIASLLLIIGDFTFGDTVRFEAEGGLLTGPLVSVSNEVAGYSGEGCSSECTLDNPGTANPTLGVNGTGTYICDYYGSNAGGYSYDQIECTSAELSPSARTWSILLLVGFCALICVRYVRKSVIEKG